jgi:hypothetical protein
MTVVYILYMCISCWLCFYIMVNLNNSVADIVVIPWVESVMVGSESDTFWVWSKSGNKKWAALLSIVLAWFSSSNSVTGANGRMHMFGLLELLCYS